MHNAIYSCVCFYYHHIQKITIYFVHVYLFQRFRNLNKKTTTNPNKNLF